MEWQTQDFNLAVALFAMGEDVIRLDRENPKRTGFVFADTERRRKIEDDFWNKRLTMEPQHLFMAFKSLKSRLYGGT